MRVYISGRIKDYPEHLEHFQRGVDLVVGKGHEAVNPCDIDAGVDPTYEDFMRADIRAMMDCDGILMLDGWEKSAGARCEHHVAAMCGLTINYEWGDR